VRDRQQAWNLGRAGTPVVLVDFSAGSREVTVGRVKARWTTTANHPPPRSATPPRRTRTPHRGRSHMAGHPSHHRRQPPRTTAHRPRHNNRFSAPNSESTCGCDSLRERDATRSAATTAVALSVRISAPDGAAPEPSSRACPPRSLVWWPKGGTAAQLPHWIAAQQQLEVAKRVEGVVPRSRPVRAWLSNAGWSDDPGVLGSRPTSKKLNANIRSPDRVRRGLSLTNAEAS